MKEVSHMSGNETRPSCTTPDINEALRHHQTTDTDWEYCDRAQWLDEWIGRFNNEFKLEIPTPALRIERQRRSRYGTYRYGRNGHGLADELTLNKLYLDRPEAEILSTLLHEMCHAWDKLYGKPGKNNYHAATFRRRMETFGIFVDERGRHTGTVPGRFTELLERFDIDTTPLLERILASPEKPEDGARRRGIREAAERGPGSKLQKWSCACTPPVNIRAAVRLRVRCLMCESEFSPAEPNW